MRIADVRDCEIKNLAKKVRESFGYMIVMTSHQLEVLNVDSTRMGEEIPPYQCLIRIDMYKEDALRAVTVLGREAEILCGKCGDPAIYARFSSPTFWCERCENIKSIDEAIRG